MAETIYLDKRVTVSGGKSILHLHNPINLHDYILSVAGGASPTIVAENGLYSPTAGTIRQGGSLIENTTINGQFEYSLGRDTEGTYIKSGSMPGSFVGQTGTFFQRGDAAVNTTYAIAGLSSTNDVYLYRNDQVTENVRSITLDATNITTTSRYGTTDFVTNVLSNGSIADTINYQFGGSAATQYTTLTSAGLTIGHTGGAPTLPATTDFYRLPDRDGTTNQVIITNGLGQTRWDTAAVAGAENGLYVSPTNNFVRLGGSLIENTQINVDTFNLLIDEPGADHQFELTPTLARLAGKDAEINFQSSSMQVLTPGYFGALHGGAANTYGTTGRLLQNVTAAGGSAEFTTYAFPTAVGTNGQILATDGTDVFFRDPSTIITANNGLTVNTLGVPDIVQLGGDLIQNTIINTTNAFTYQVNDGTDAALTVNGTTQLASIGATNVSIELDPSRIALKTNTYTGTGQGTIATSYGTAGKLVQNINAGTGEIDVTPYDLPLTSGTVGQELVIDGASHVTWRTRPEIIAFQEFLVQEELIVRAGETLWTVPAALNGWQLQSIKTIVAATGANDAIYNLVIGITTTPITITANTQIINTAVAQTVTTDQILQVNVTTVGASAPSGLTLILEFNRIS